MQIKQAVEKDMLIQVLHTWVTLQFSADDSNSKRHEDEECAGMVLSCIHNPCPQSGQEYNLCFGSCHET